MTGKIKPSDLDDDALDAAGEAFIGETFRNDQLRGAIAAYLNHVFGPEPAYWLIAAAARGAIAPIVINPPGGKTRGQALIEKIDRMINEASADDSARAALLDVRALLHAELSPESFTPGNPSSGSTAAP